MSTSGDMEWQARSYGWVWAVLAVVVLAAGVGGYWLYSAKTPRPDRVLVAVVTERLDGTRHPAWREGGDEAQALADHINAYLDDRGMDVQKGPATLKALRDRAGSGDLAGSGGLEAVARSLEAGYLVEETIRVAKDSPLTGAYHEFELEVTIRAVELLGESATVTPARGAPFRLAVEALTEEEALAAAMEDIQLMSPSLVAMALAETPELTRLRESPSSKLSREDAPVVKRIGRLLGAGGLLAGLLDARQRTADEAAAEDLQGEHGRTKHWLGGFEGERYWVGRGPGAGILLETEPLIPFLDVKSKELRFFRSQERIVLQMPDGTPAKTIHAAFNYFGAMSTTPDGLKVACVLDLRQRGKSLEVIDVQTGKSTRVLEHAEHYPSGPTLSPDGQWVSFWYRTCRRCPSRFEVMRVDGTRRRVLVEDFDFMRTPVFSPDSKTLYVTFNPKGGAHSLWAFAGPPGAATPLLGEAADAQPAAADGAEPGAGGAEAEAGDGAGERVVPEYREIALAPDGAWLLVCEDAVDGRFLGRYQLVTKAYERVTEAHCKRLAVAPDGKRAAFETWGEARPEDPYRRDKEIAMVVMATGAVSYLTANDRRDDLLGWSRDGAKVFFAQRDRTEALGRQARVVFVEP